LSFCFSARNAFAAEKQKEDNSTFGAVL